jgi:deoxyhypusine synthase
MVDPRKQDNAEQFLQKALQANYVKSEELDESKEMKVEGYNFDNGLDYEKVFKSYISTGF